MSIRQVRFVTPGAGDMVPRIRHCIPMAEELGHQPQEYGKMTVYGPYTRSDGRKHVIHYDGVTRRTQSYPRYLMEQHLGRVLEVWEHVDHKNDDFTDDRIENLQLLTQAENNRKSKRKIFYVDCECPVCGDNFMYPYTRYKSNQIKQGKRGPYCGRSCAGKAGMVE